MKPFFHKASTTSIWLVCGLSVFETARHKSVTVGRPVPSTSSATAFTAYVLSSFEAEYFPAGMPFTNPSSHRPRKAPRGLLFFRDVTLVGYRRSIALFHRASGLELAANSRPAANSAASPYLLAKLLLFHEDDLTRSSAPGVTRQFPAFPPGAKKSTSEETSPRLAMLREALNC
jgi:hypothetical protein